MKLYENNNILILDENYPDFFINLLKTNGHILNQNQSEIRTLLDWKVVKYSCKIVYYFENCEKLIKSVLSDSVINNKSINLFIEFGPNEPMVKMNGNYFIEHWDDFILDYGSMGTTIISEDGKYILEFTDDTDWLLYTNFPIDNVVRG